MRAFIMACIALVALSFGAYYGLGEIGFTTQSQTSSPGVRLD
ncbi:MAG: hypothetical protein AAGB05_04520 [Pseudomonadota bacterium]